MGNISFMQKVFSIRKTADRKHKILRLLGIKFKFKIKNKKSIKAAKIIHKNVKKYKYVHIMKNDKFNKPFVDFLNKNFDKNEHMVLCYRDPSYNDIIQKFPVGDNVFEYFDINDINLNGDKNIEKVIIHSLFMPNIVPYLYKNKELLKEKAYWVIWGGDLYNAPRDEINDYVRENFKGIIYLINDDKEFYNKLYAQYKGKEYFAPYIFPINLKLLKEIKSSKKDYIQIQINNSCDDSTLEMLDVLSKFKDENIKITTILSCGKMQFKDEIIKKGQKIFGDKFEYVDKLLSAQDYAQHIAQNDILILNQNRQQGVGNILASLFLKAKVYIKKEVSTNNYFNKTGINVFDTENISKESFEEFIENKFSENSKLIVQDLMDEFNIAQKWSNIFYENNSYDIKK